MSKPQMTIETITPTIAEKMLERTNGQRGVRKSHVTYLAKSIKSGQWKTNGEAIKIATNGQLLDGQHRLRAVIASKTPIESVVIRGLPHHVISTMDLGAARTIGNHLQVAGYKGAVFSLAAAAIICLDFNNGTYKKEKVKVSPDEVLGFIEKNRSILKSNEYITSKEAMPLRDLLPQSISTALHFVFKKINRDKAETFFQKLITGTNLGAASPILKLRTELISMRQESKYDHVTREAFIHYVTSAFKAYLNDERPSSLPEYKKGIVITLPRA